jgi:hypothetical protein
MSREIQYLPLTELKEDPKNPKAHSLEELDRSVGRFGVVDIIARDERTGRVISGHGRTKTLRAMEKRGEEPPDGVRTDEKGRWLVPVVTGWSSRTDAEATAALIALNRTTELGGWVDDELLALLDDLTAEGDHGLVGVGYGEDDIDALRQRLAESGSEEPEALAAGQGYVSEVPEFDGGAVDLGEGAHACPRCRFTFDD